MDTQTKRFQSTDLTSQIYFANTVKYSSVAQSVEQVAVNHLVGGSSPS